MRIDQPEDRDDAPASVDLAAVGVPDVREAPKPDAADPPDVAGRTERTLEHRARVDAAYRTYAIDQGCARVEKIEREMVTPAMRRIEAEDPERHLAGLEHRLKERYRIEEKVTHDIEKRGVSASDAFATMKDAIRYTYCYPDDHYADGVPADCERLKAAGFEHVDSRNWWPHDEYKGFNSWWRVPENGQLFEVQFHTQASLDAKEETHAAYERLRKLPPDHAEVRDLRAYQREVTAKIPMPPGALDISIS
ncbi:hypothetical protein EAS64_09380 [Trebonia kvetii]|uniref:RelA/SpoT domain-containing protein n=1 Tax=Trebonia kvetii TaxID=2480626 RepID=A0A6P2C2Z0_9ACTN|nr:hypothetical protein [Trebonia kvetii]TVZ04846.1 hypothetical protein EAS64_09380 [Trebonia kvetii]